ncbi:velvet factor-domain-containing protein [Lipomyces chichibuensis]|uniref:velvet factor-domain-containing protein n=1 Tax=Lipomyces chichibuensis TaxID=1546026 RepID=UPI0033434167
MALSFRLFRSHTQSAALHSKSKLALLVRPPASILRNLASVSSATGPVSDLAGESSVSSNDGYDDNDNDTDSDSDSDSDSDRDRDNNDRYYDDDDDSVNAKHQIAVENTPARGKKRKRSRRKPHSPASDPGIRVQLCEPTGPATSRSRTAITNLIDPPSPLTAPNSVVPTPGPQQSPAPSQSPATVHVPSAALRRGLRIEDYILEIRQQPIRCKAAGTSERALADRKAVDPPPIIQLTISDGDSHREWLQSPFFFMCANLYDPVVDTPITRPPSETLAGTLVSSLHRVRDGKDREGGYFVFGDLSIKLEGKFRLQFNLFEMLDGAQVEFITSTISDVFTVYSSRQYPGVLESTTLSRQFSDQGVRLRLRKETGTRNGSSASNRVQAPDDLAPPTAAGSESTMEASTPSSVATNTPVIMTSSASPSAKPPKLAYTPEAGDHAPRTRTRASSRTSSTPKHGPATSFASQPSKSLNRPTSSSGSRGPANIGAETKCEATNADDPKDYHYDRPQQYSAPMLSHSPQQLQQYYRPVPNPPPPPPLPPPPSTMYPQRDENHYDNYRYRAGQLPASHLGHPRRISHQPYYSAPSQQLPQYPVPWPTRSTGDVAFQPQPQPQQHQHQFGGIAYSTTTAPHHPQPAHSLPLSRPPRLAPPAILHPSLSPRVPRLTGNSLMRDGDGRWRLPPIVFGDPGATGDRSVLNSPLPAPSKEVSNGPYIHQLGPPMSFDSATRGYGHDGHY